MAGHAHRSTRSSRRARAQTRLRTRALRLDVNSSVAPKSSTVVIVASAGVLLGALIVFADVLGWNRSARDLVSEPPFLTWFFIVCAQAAGWSVAAVFVYRIDRELWPHRTRHMREIVTAAALLFALMAVFSIIANARSLRYPVPYYEEKMLVLTALAFAVALAAAVGIWLVHAALESLFEGATNPTAEQIEQFAHLRERMHLLLTIQGAILGGAILGAGALRHAIVAHEPHKAADFPPELVLVYGAFLSSLVALSYAPAYARARRLGTVLRDACLEAPVPGEVDWSSWYGHKQALDGVLGLAATTGESMRAGIAIITPLATGLVTLLLGSAH